MYAWLIYDRAGAAKNADYIAYHKRAAEEYGITIVLKIVENIRITWEEAYHTEKPDFAIVRTIRPALSKKLEELGLVLFNNAKVAEICNDKGKTTAYIADHSNVPVIRTERFQRSMLSPALLAEYTDSVIKSVDGHGGRQVFLTAEPYDKIQKGIGTSDFVIQPFVHGPGQDVRVYVIGEQIIAAVKRTSLDGFRSNYSLGGSVERYELSKREIEMVKTVTSLFSFGLVGIDFMIGEDGCFIFNEIEDVVGARMLYQCTPGEKLLERYFSYIVEKLLQYPR